MTSARYSSVATILHWAIAALIIGQFFGGLYMHNLPNASPVKFDLYQLHKSFGLSILVLSLMRLGWRLTHKAPPLPAAMPTWQKLAARGTHWAFYALMILTPLAGWAIVSVSPTDIPTKFFGVIPVPHLPFLGGVSDREAVEHIMEERHELLAKLIMVLLVAHVGAALKHAILDKDGVFQSMTPTGKSSWFGIAGIFAVLGAGALIYLSTTSSATAVVQEHHHDEASAGNWLVDYEASELNFIGEEAGARFEGEFKNFSADITFDPDNLAGSKVTVTVSTASAESGSDLRDTTMPGAEWFDVKNHPDAVFTTSVIRSVGDGGYEADGSLTIKDIEQPVSLSFTLEIDGDQSVSTGHAELIRTDFGLGAASSWLDEEGVGLAVRVEFEIHATRKN